MFGNQTEIFGNPRPVYREDELFRVDEKLERFGKMLERDPSLVTDFQYQVEEAKRQEAENSQLFGNVIRQNYENLGAIIQDMDLELKPAHTDISELELVSGHEEGAGLEDQPTPLGEPVDTRTLLSRDYDFDSSLGYLFKTAWGQSTPGMIVNWGLPEYDPYMEAQLGRTGRAIRNALGLVPEIPLIMASGGTVSLATRGLLYGARKAAPRVMAKMPQVGRLGGQVYHGSSAFGLYNGTRQMYYDAIVEGEISSREQFLDRAKSAALAFGQGTMLGAIGAGGAYWRSNIQGIQYKAGQFVSESAAMTTLAKQFYDPLSWPTAEEFLEGFIFDVGLNAAFAPWWHRRQRDPAKEVIRAKVETGYNTFAPEWSAYDFFKEHAWYFDKYKNAFITYGVHPKDLAREAHTDLGVMENLSNPLAYNIRKYDIEIGNDGYALLGENTFIEAYRILEESAPKGNRRIEEQEESEVFAEMEGGEFTAQQVQKPPATAAQTIPANAMNPLRLGNMDSFQIYDMGGGRQVVVPTDYPTSMAMTGTALMENPLIVKEILDATGGNFPRQVERVVDPLTGKERAVSGFFTPAEGGWARRVRTLANRVKATEKRIEKERANGFDPVASVQLLQKLQKELAVAQAEGLQNSDMQVGFNRQTLTGEGPFEKLWGPTDSPEVTHGRILLTLTHEFGHMLDYMSSRWDEGASEIDSPILAKLVGAGQTMQNFNQNVTGLQQVVYDNIMAEAKALSLLWRPMEISAFEANSYRQLSAELMADVNSVILNNPDVARQVAPTIMKKWDDYLNDRPEEAQRIRDLMDLMQQGKALEKVTEMLAGNMYGFGRAEELSRAAERAKAAAGTNKFDQTYDMFLNAVFDSAYAALKHTGGDRFARNALERYQFVGSTVYAYAERVNREVMTPLFNAGLTDADIGLLLFFRRNMNDETRQKLVNAFGFDKQSSAKEYDRLLNEKYTSIVSRSDIEGALERFYDIRQETVVKMAEESGLFSDAALEVMKNNREYARIELVRYHEKKLNQLSEDKRYAINTGLGNILTTQAARQRVQRGSFEPIVNPFAATLENDMLMIRTIRKFEAMRAVVQTMQRQDGAILTRSEWNSKERAEMLKERGLKEGQLALIEFPHRVEVVKLDQDGNPVLRPDGEAETTFITRNAGFYVPRSVADVFKGSPALVRKFYEFVEASGEQWREAGPGVKGLMAVAKTFDASADFFRFMAVVANVGFQFANLKYEVSRTSANAPAVSGSAVKTLTPKIGLAPYYLQAMASQIKNRIKGLQYEGIYGEMVDKGIVTIGRRYGDDIEGTDIAERIIGEYSKIQGRRTAKLAPTIDFAWSKIARLGDGLQYTLDTVEAISNEAAYRYLKANQDRIAVTDKDGNRRVGISDEQAEIMARTQLGAPAYRRRGHYGALLNVVFPFSNTIKEGIRGDFEAFQGNKATYMARVFTGVMIPQIALALVEAGFFDSEEQAELQGATWSGILETKSEFQKNTKFVFPVFLNRDDDKGGTFMIPMEQNPVKRAISAFTRQSVLALVEASRNGDADATEIVKELVGLTSQVLLDVEGDLPGFSPGVASAVALQNIWKGEPGNVKSTFQSGGDYFTREQQARMNADDWRRYVERAKGSLQYMADSFALPELSRLVRDNEEDFSVLEAWQKLRNPPEDADFPYYAGYMSQLLKIPLGYGFSGWFSYGDGGIKEKLYHLQQEDAREAAARRMRAERNADKMEDGEPIDLDNLDDKDAEALQREVERRQYEGQNPHMKRFFRYDSEKQREYILDRQKRVER